MSNFLYSYHVEVVVIIIIRETSMAFSRYCLKLRKNRELSQLELSEILGLSESQLRNLEKERTKLPRPEVFQKLAEYLDKDVFDVAYDVFFNDDGLKKTNDPFIELNRKYLVSRWFDGYLLEPNTILVDSNSLQMHFDGSFWKMGYGHKKCLIACCNRKTYLSALNDPDKTGSLKKAVFSDSFFIEELANINSFREIRFVLDKNNDTDCRIFNEIKNIRLVNLGKNIDVSYVLFDPDSKQVGLKSELHYATDRSLSIDL